jgi:hypothetical protein
MKPVERAKLVRSLRQESRRLRLLVLVIGFFLVTLTFVVISKPDALLFNLNGRLSVDHAPRSLLIRQRIHADSRRSADTFPAAEDPKVVDEDEGAEDATAKGTSEEEKRLLSSEPEQGKNEEAATASEVLGEPSPSNPSIISLSSSVSGCFDSRGLERSREIWAPSIDACFMYEYFGGGMCRWWRRRG